MDKDDTKNKKGFIRAIILLIVLLVIASFLGFHPKLIWDDYISELFLFFWGVIVTIVEFIVSLIQGVINAVKFLINLI